MSGKAELTDWFKDAKYGVFVHYLYGLQNDPEGLRQLCPTAQTSWEECVDSFDTEKFADEMVKAGAGYVFFTVMQMLKYFCVPCATYDRYTGYAPGEACTKRDLVNDLYDSLNKRGIKLMLYTTGDGPSSDEQASIGICGEFPLKLNPMFTERWSECMRELSLRYGKKVSGWWVDGCYRHKGYSDNTFFRRFAEALRAGNPDTLIAFNYYAGQRGYNGDILQVTEYENYAAGEIYQGLDKNHPYPQYRWAGNDQWHALCYLGHDWAFPDLRYPDGFAADYVKKCTDAGGVVSIDVGLYRDAGISAGQMNQLKEIRKAVRGTE
jgi:hypothetical protein